MLAKDHTVNILNQPYHHGDLRAALIRAGLALIQTRTTDDLSLREMARAVGVSANAVYRHFPNKQALKAALASEGLQLLAAAQRAASSGQSGTSQGFKATGRAYVTFAHQNPALFRLMFASPLRGGAGTNRDAGADALAMLHGNAATNALDGQEEDVLALRAWSIAHGLAMLILDGQVSVDDRMVDAVFELDHKTVDR